MASTYSDLKIELIGTGEQSGTWGTTTNTNLGNAALGEAITGSADVAFSSADVTVTLTDTNASQTARNLRLNLTGTTGGARSLILGSGCQIEKLYLVNNTCADAITVKNTSGTGIAVAAGKSMFVYNNGTNVVEAVTQFNGTIALATGVSGVLPVANGGTGTSSTTFVNAATNVTGTLPVANGGTGVTSSTGTTAVVLSTSPTLVTPVLGVATATSVNKVALTAPATGSTLTIADGKTLTASNSLTLAGTDATTMTFPSTTSKIGYLNIPPAGTKTTSYTLAVGDVGEYVQVGSGGSITIPNATFAEGDAISIFNNTSGDITITCTITTAYIGGTDADKATVSLATRGVCTILFISGTVCVITGNVS
jgi:hypothetical protein